MKFYPIPRFYPTVPDFARLDAEMAEFRKFVMVPGNITWFASQRVVNGVIPSQGPTVKPWRDNAAIYKPGQSEFFHIVQRGEVALRLRTSQSDAGTITVDAEGITALEGFYSRAAIEFYNRRFLQSGGKEFARIPRLMGVNRSREESARLNLEAPYPVDPEWALGIFIGDGNVTTTLNPDMALRFRPDGRVEAFSVTEYDREFPLVAGTTGDEELVETVQAILADPSMSVADKARAIRLVARG